MADDYTATGQEPTMSTAYQTAVGLIASTTVRGRLWEVQGSCSGTSNDYAIRWVLQRFTVSAGTAVTENPLDPAAPTNLLTAKEAWDTAGTWTANTELIDQGINLRGLLHWIAAGPDKGFVVPATSDNGIGLRALNASYTGAFEGTLWWLE